MSLGQHFLLGLVSGFFVRDTLRIVWGRYLMWRFTRDHKAAVARMVGCTHERTVRVNTGGPGAEPSSWTRKCLKCWALEFQTPLKGKPGELLTWAKEWCPNAVRPEDVDDA